MLAHITSNYVFLSPRIPTDAIRCPLSHCWTSRTQLGVCLSCIRWNTETLTSAWNRLNLLSLVKSMRCQSPHWQRWSHSGLWIIARWSSRIIVIPRRGQYAFKPATCNCLLTLCLISRKSSALAGNFVTVRNRFRRCNARKDLSPLDVVTCGLPRSGMPFVEPVWRYQLDNALQWTTKGTRYLGVWWFNRVHPNWPLSFFFTQLWHRFDVFFW